MFFLSLVFNVQMTYMKKHAIAIHGGAGTILRTLMSPEQEAGYRQALENAVMAADSALSQGAFALDAVEIAVRSLEDDPHFNAGKGSVFTSDGRNEMDASIMDGRTLMAGAVTSITNLRNPITLARAIMERSDHVFLSGSGAQEFAHMMGLPFEPDEYFFDQMRYEQLLKARSAGKITLDHTGETGNKFGTVGAVVLDIYGNIASGTSTGGMTNKKHGRVGDTPIIGAGTYANNNTCAVSCTGHGEFFIRSVVAYDISCLMEYKGFSLKDACHEVVMKKLVSMGGEGGVIALDPKGNIEMVFNCDGMYRACKSSDAPIYIGIYKD
jgi:beta-aspartyl-peptidase (threonine type)